MSATRIPFDPAAPFVVACESLVCGPARLVRGDPFPWRDLGMTEFDLLALWVALKIDATAPAAEVDLDKLTPAQLAALDAATAPAAKPARRR